MARRLGLGAVADRSNQRRRRQRSYARRGREALAFLAGFVPGKDFPLHRAELHGKCVEVIDQGRESCARLLGQDPLARVFHAAPELADPSNSLRRNEPELAN